jgi:uncharacterized tellurite resistance protein B-like protein
MSKKLSQNTRGDFFMLELLKKIRGEETDKASDPKDKVQDADTALCVLLLEAAHIDGECSLEEKEQLINTLVATRNLPRESIDAFLAMGDKERQEAVDIFRFTRYMNNNFSKEEKIEVMEAVWRILLIDDFLEKHEDHFAHKLANLLRLTHKELIDAKLKARKQLADE